MENASKALIIAGAILLAIVIISLGLIVVNNTRNVTDNTNLSEQEIQAFNAKFTPYEGDSVAGSRVNSLIQQVIATNQATATNGKGSYVMVCYKPLNYNSSYIVISGNSNGEIISSNAGGKDTAKRIKDYASCTLEKYNALATVPQLAVKTGENYIVECNYKDGLVSKINIYQN